MRKRRPAIRADEPEPFRYRPTPPPPVPAASQHAEPSRSSKRRPQRQQRQQAAAGESSRRPRLPVGGLSNRAAVVWFLLLVLPALALRRLSEVVDWRVIAGAVLFVSLVTWFLYRGDKSKAQSGAWRTPESTLHLAELAGGWPAAFLAQRRYRHKIAKQSYQWTYWSIVVLYEYTALDYLLGWRLFQGVLQLLPGQAAG